MSAVRASIAHLRIATPFSDWRAATSRPEPPGNGIVSRAIGSMPPACICSGAKSCATLS
jgi:hypothetical protein